MYSKGALEADSQFPPVATYLPTRLCLPCNTLRSCSFEGVYLTTHILWLEGRCGFLILDAQKIQADVAWADLLLLLKLALSHAKMMQWCQGKAHPCDREWGLFPFWKFLTAEHHHHKIHNAAWWRWWWVCTHLLSYDLFFKSKQNSFNAAVKLKDSPDCSTEVGS